MANFADYLNGHKSPSVSKSSTFNLIPDNFSSLDNNFLHRTVEQLGATNSDSVSISTYFNKSIRQNFAISNKGELHSNSWNLTLINKLQFPLNLRSFVFEVSKHW